MRRLLAILGLLNVLVLAVHAGLSWFEAGAATYAARPYGQVVFYDRFGARVADVAYRVAPAAFANFQKPDTTVRRPGALVYPPPDPEDHIRTVKRQFAFAIGGDLIGADLFIDAYALPLIASTLLALGAVLLVARGPVADVTIVRSAWRWGVAFVLVMAVAMPVLVPDFWLSFAWGRTLWWGGNPYYDVPAAAVDGLPFDAPILRMTYGPLWAVISWVVTAVTSGSVFWGTVVFKALLAGSWIAVLALVRHLTNDRPPREQAMALVVAGWAPLGAVQVGGDGHNDAFMILGILSWLALVRLGRYRWATLSLAASVAVKYVSAPLFLLDLLLTPVPGVAHPTFIQRVRAWIPRGLIAGVFWVVVFAPFVRSPAFFAETSAVREGYFFLPADAIKAIGALTGLGLRPLAFLVMGVFPVVTAACVWSWWRSPSFAGLQRATAAIMLSVLFIAAAHVWPWYVLWLAIPAVLLPWESLLARWSVGVLLAAPFPLAYWTAWPDSGDFRKFELPSLAMYGLALGWMLVGWRLFRARADVTVSQRPETEYEGFVSKA
ncbi:MAG: hypothetical protein IT361_01120 [Gemmatimonadaceae bacterium]|nr:hypothetical protein [Gemmatimonadaceae bacterium]